MDDNHPNVLEKAFFSIYCKSVLSYTVKNNHKPKTSHQRDKEWLIFEVNKIDHKYET